MLGDERRRTRFGGADAAQQVLGERAELLGVGALGQGDDGHSDPLGTCGPLLRAPGGGFVVVRVRKPGVDSALPAGPEALPAPVPTAHERGRPGVVLRS
ncbi:hypothetical protein [Saccharothrix yanglingensis]|uniref:Uncharacterized protein n=1 Tax=Saccharothrix yanglingensis TaxID=659496 RepID=A0ABU0X000_9PSEU|nr:hypothetical protein [Saccharothrix yanglingensis]MDQ2585440.1 hypothetical protein [Saccharothrix yanglingensis]